MRNLLIDDVRRKQAVKHGGEFRQVAFDEALPTSITTARYEEILAVDEALQSLEKDYPRVAKVVELRFFLGFTEAETAAVLNLDERTVRRDWAFAKGWLALRLKAAA